MNDTGAAIIQMIVDVHSKLEKASKAGTVVEELHRMANRALEFLEAPRSTVGDDPLLGLEERVAIRKAIAECEKVAKRLAGDSDYTEARYDRFEESRRIIKVRDGYRRQR